jgi:two-component system, NtrC family, nitrogen regulation sensor histidine kinase NtrY
MFPIRRAKKSAEPSHQPRFEKRLLFSILLAGLPGVVLGLLLLWRTGFSLDHKLEITALVVLLWFGFTASARDHVVNSLRVLSNVISAVKDEDFSFRATLSSSGDSLGDLALEINNLSRALGEERRGAIETTGLLRKIMAEAGTIIFAFSADNRLSIVNNAGASFLGKREDEVLNRTAQELGIENLLEGPAWEVVSHLGADPEKRWIVRRGSFRQRGEPRRLIVLSEASEVLRAEERAAWQRLIRVLGHEINNSLAPIRSIARTLRRMTSAIELPTSISENLNHGLDVIHDRADSLNRFLQNYTRVAQVPKPQRRAVALDSLIGHAAALESRLVVNVIPGPKVCISVDPDLLEQALINLIKNAADSVLLNSEKNIGPAAVTVFWTTRSRDLEIWIQDEGVGLGETENLFVPFYTTKQSGSGIGLLLSRQIIESHQGVLMLRNRTEHTGCEVELKLPECIIAAPEVEIL